MSFGTLFSELGIVRVEMSLESKNQVLIGGMKLSCGSLETSSISYCEDI
jgi:hypothetical protein